MSRRRRRLASSAQPAPALDDDNILSEILLRLPPLPSSLPRASLVCRRWRRLVADPYFLRRFRGHHRKPPLLGFFNQWHWTRPEFTSVLDSPDTIPAARFCLRLDSIHSRISDCHHGRVLFLDRTLDYFLVWDPVTGKDRQVDFPPVFSMWSKDRKFVTKGAVVCAASEQGHVHGSCHSSPFKVVLLANEDEGISACVYSSETSWGNAVSLLWPQNISGVDDCPNTLSGNSIYWLLYGKRHGILKFDLCRQSLEAIELPSDAVFSRRWSQFLITPADDGGLNVLYLSGFSAQVWKWKANCDGGAGWMLGSIFDLKSLLSLKSGVGTSVPKILGMVEDDSTMLLSTDVGDFMLHLESMEFKKLPVRVSHKNVKHYPFSSFYSTGHITEGAHPLNANGSMKRTISSVIRSERAASGVGRNSKNQIRKRAGPSMVEGHKSLFGGQSKERIQLNIEGDASDNFIPHMFESEVPTSIEEVQGACSERSRSKILAVKGNSSSSTMPPTQGAKKKNSTVVRKQQPEPTQEYSIANCIHAMREMVDLSDEEKVLSCDLFRDAANREIFLSLDGILRTMWLKRQLTKNRWE